MGALGDTPVSARSQHDFWAFEIAALARTTADDVQAVFGGFMAHAHWSEREFVKTILHGDS